MKRLAAAGIGALMALAGIAHAQDNYPSRSIELIIPFSPGGANDTFGRVLAEQLAKQLGVAVVPINMPGANSQVAGKHVADSPPDGYKVFYNSSAMVQNTLMPVKQLYDPFTDLRPVSQVSEGVQVLVISSAKYPEIKTVQQFVELARSKELSYGSSGVGNIAQLLALVALKAWNAEGLHVTFSGGGEIMTAVVSGEIDFAFQSITAAKGFIDAGSMTPLAVSSLRRAEVLPDVPTMDESVAPGYNYTLWSGVMVPAGTPDAIVEKLNAAIVKGLADEATREVFRNNATLPVGSSPEEYAAFMISERERMRDMLILAEIIK